MLRSNSSSSQAAACAAQQIAVSGVPMQPILFETLARVSGKAARSKAGSYELEPGATPNRLIEQLVRGEFAQESLSIIEGWTFKQKRQAIAEHNGLKHDTVGMTESELLDKVAPDYAIYAKAEGLFFPDTYLSAIGASDLQINRQAHAVLIKRLAEEWARRDPSVPYK